MKNTAVLVHTSLYKEHRDALSENQSLFAVGSYREKVPEHAG